MRDFRVEEADGSFVLPLEGFVCTEVRGSDLILRRVDSTDESWVSGTDIGEGVARQLVERGARVSRAVVTRDSTLQIDFDDGVAVVNPPADDVEAWEVRGPGHVLVVALPGGGEPAVWDSTSEIRVVHPGDPLPKGLVRMIESFGFPIPTGEFELRCTRGARRSFELHPPNAPVLSRSEIVRFYDTESEAKESEG
ncbi:MAG TPA: DUF6188 family protein [Gaiellaceae bacterium]